MSRIMLTLAIMLTVWGVLAIGEGFHEADHSPNALWAVPGGVVLMIIGLSCLARATVDLAREPYNRNEANR